MPEIAQAHHEKLDGSGYPYRMNGGGDSLPVEDDDDFGYLRCAHRHATGLIRTRVPIERALNIIGDEVKSKLLDPVLFNLFVEAKIYQLTAKD